jgi:hypothetical protein
LPEGYVVGFLAVYWIVSVDGTEKWGPQVSQMSWTLPGSTSRRSVRQNLMRKLGEALEMMPLASWIDDV